MTGVVRVQPGYQLGACLEVNMAPSPQIVTKMWPGHTLQAAELMVRVDSLTDDQYKWSTLL